MTYCRSGFECEILLIANCEFLHKTQSKESQEKEYAMNNVTRDHTPFARYRRYHACSIYLHACTAINLRE